MKTFTEEELKAEYPNFERDLCYIVEGSYDFIDDESYTTDQLDEAVEKSKERDYHIYVFTKKLMKDCLDADYLLDNLVDNVEQNGIDSGWLYSMLSTSTKQEFYSFVTKWFDKVVGSSYLADEFIGELENGL